MRARIILACADGQQNKDVAAALGVDPMTVGKWRRRVQSQRLDGLHNEPRPGTPRSIDDSRIDAVLVRTLESQPAGSRTGRRASSCQPIPHSSPSFATWWVFMWLPPEQAVALCVDETSQIQALDRSQAVFPMKPGPKPERRSHDDTRHGTASLFAALDVATGRVIGKCYPHHRAEAFRHFLDEIEARVPADPDVHLVWDTYATHTTAIIHDWLAKRPRWPVPLTPTSRSGLNQVERFFALLTQRQIERGVHRGVEELENAINAFLHPRNAHLKAFKWIKTADNILSCH